MLFQGWCPSTDGRGILEELVLLLCSLRNLISSSTHSSVVRGHVEFQTLGSFLSGDRKSARLESHWEFQGRDYITGR